MKTLKIKSSYGFEHSINCNDSDIITIDGNVIFVEGEKYVPKIGDIFAYVFNTLKPTISIYKNGIIDIVTLDTYNNKVFYNIEFCKDVNKRLATEAEKQILFDALAKDGKVWNPETMEIEELRWKPKVGEKYYYFTSWVRVSSCNCVNGSVDSDRFNAGNCFKTKSECQEKIEQIKAILK